MVKNLRISGREAGSRCCDRRQQEADLAEQDTLWKSRRLTGDEMASVLAGRFQLSTSRVHQTLP